MARPKYLTDANIKTMKPEAARYIVKDRECPGLYLRVTPAGSKSFIVIARDPRGTQVWREVADTVAAVHSLEDVRPKAREGIKRIKAGMDPFPPPPPKPETFKAIAEDFITRHVKAKRLITADEIERCLERYVYPVWKDRVFTEIRRSDINRLLNTIVDENGARQADYVLAIVRKIMNWYASQGIDDEYVSPVVRGMRRTAPEGRARDRMLSDDEIRLLWPILDASGTFGALLQVALLTAQRREKVAGMKWADVSVDGVWTIPGEAREKGSGGTLALPEMATKIIRAQTRIEGNPYVFPGRGEGHFEGFSPSKRRLDDKVAEAVKEAKGVPLPEWRIHDLRRTARSLMARAGVDSDTAERVLGHKLVGVEGIYNRHQYGPEKKIALQKLAVLVTLILNPPKDNVAVLNDRRA